MMEGKIIKVLLFVIVFMTMLNYFESCNARKETNRQLKKEMDSVNTKIDKLTIISEARRDTIKNNTIYQTKIIKEAEGKKDEVAKTDSIDNVITNYYLYRPVESN